MHKMSVSDMKNFTGPSKVKLNEPPATGQPIAWIGLGADVVIAGADVGIDVMGAKLGPDVVGEIVGLRVVGDLVG